MTTATRAVQEVVALGLVLVALLSLRDWLRNSRTVSSAFQFMAIGSLAMLSVIGQVRTVWSGLASVLYPFSLICFLGSGYSLWLLRSLLLPARPLLRYAIPFALGASAIFSVVITLLFGVAPSGLSIPAWQLAGLLVLVLTWIVAVSEPAVQFWLRARGRGAVQRYRMRALSAGYLSIVAIFILAIFASTRLSNPNVQFAFQLITLPIVALLWAAFSPPRWLRSLWRGSEQSKYQQAVWDMVLYSPDVQTLAMRAVGWAIRFVGADSGCIVTPDGILAISGDPGYNLEAEIPQLRDAPAGLVHLDHERLAIVTDLRVNTMVYRLATISGAFTPIFGEDEFEQLRAYAAVVSIAIERADISQRVAGLERTKSEFLNLASHELGGPLTILRGYLSMLVARDITDPGAAHNILITLQRQTERMAMIVAQMLESARIDDDRLELKRQACDLGTITERVIADQLEVLPDTHRLILVPTTAPLPIQADVERLRTIIRNLVDNAVKYSPDGGVVECRLGQVGDRAELEVADQGIGIDPADYPRLFQRFGRVVGNAHADIPGTGLGLYLCQELARRHGGEVRVQPGKESGSCFTLSLPLAVRATSFAHPNGSSGDHGTAAEPLAGRAGAALN